MPKPLWAPWRLEYVEQVDERPGCIFCEPEPELVLFRGEHAFLLLNRFPYSQPLGSTPSSPSTGPTGTTSAGTSAAPPVRASSTTSTCTSCHAGSATRTSC